MSAQSIALLQADLTALSKEAGRRHSDVRDAADKAAQLVKTAKDKDDALAEPAGVYHPIFLASATRNAKVIALAVSALQRLISARAVPATLVTDILDTLERVAQQGVEIQLKTLQTLVSLLTTTTGYGHVPLVTGEELGRALELAHRLSTSKIPVVASTASATLRQMFMFVYDRIVDEDTLVNKSSDPDHDPNVPRATFDVDVPPVEQDRAAASTATASDRSGNEMRSIKLRPAARDAYLLLEDLCLLIAGSVEGGPDGEPSFLRWSSLSRTFGLELVESIVSGFGPVVRTHPELLLVLRAHLCPLLIRFLSSPPPPASSSSSHHHHLQTSSSSSSSSSSSAFSFPLTLRLTRVVFLLLKHFSDLLTLESEVFLTMFVRIIAPATATADSGGGGGGSSSSAGAGEGGHPAGPGAGAGTSPVWMRVLALEIFRGLCGDFDLMIKFYQRYDAAAAAAAVSAPRGKGKRVDAEPEEEPSVAAGGSTVFSDLMTAFNRLATERPSALGTGHAVLYGSSMGPVAASVVPPHHHQGTGSTMIDSAVEMGLGLAHAAGSVVGSSASAVVAVAGDGGGGGPGAGGGEYAAQQGGAGLDAATASIKLQCIDQLDKAEPPAIPETYVFLLALQCLVALAEGFATVTLATYAAVVADRAKSAHRAVSKAPPALEWNDDDDDDDDEEEDPKVETLRITREMAETSWPALLASLSFFVATHVSDDLFLDVVHALEAFTCVCGVLNLATPREAFLTSLCKFAIPPAVVSHFASSPPHDSTPTPTVSSASAAVTATATAVLSAGAESLGLTSSSSSHSSPGVVVGLSSRNLACLRALLAVAHYLAGSLGRTWFSVFEALQNADFVLRASTSAQQKPPTKKRSTTAADEGGGGTHNKKKVGLPAVPTEADEHAIQRGIAALFEVSKALDDDALRDFVGALCRLNGEMLGIAMNPDGTTAAAAAAATTPQRRRSSGMMMMTAAAKSSDSTSSFGIAKLGVVALFNVQRLVTAPRARAANDSWDLVTRHLLGVVHAVAVPTSIRTQAADVLDSALVLAPKHLAQFPDDVQHAAQTRILEALAAQAEPQPHPHPHLQQQRVETGTDVELRRTALESLRKILETHGHAFGAGWDRIFHVLRTACPTATPHHDPSRRSLDTIVEGDKVEPPRTPPPRSAKTSILVRTSFPSLQLICSDFLGALGVPDLRDCIGTLAEFGRQADDVNVALTAGGLLWSVSDHVQAKRRDEGATERDRELYGDLWMFLLDQLASLCRDRRQEVRDAAITNLFRSISMYGHTLSRATWRKCCHDIIFPLVDDISAAAREAEAEAEAEGDEGTMTVVPQAHGPPIRLVDKQWDDSKTLALRSIGDVLFEYLAQIVKTDRFEETWEVFVGHVSTSFVSDRAGPATAAMHALEKVLTVSLESAEASRITSSWQVAWRAWDEIGAAIENAAASDKVWTQVNLEAFVRSVVPIYTPPYLSFDLAQVRRLLAVLKAVLVYARSPDYRADVDGLMPLQQAVLEVVAVIKLDAVPGAVAAVLTDLAEYLTLAFVAPFDAPPTTTTTGRVHAGPPPPRVTFIALTKEVTPHVLWLYQKYRDDPSIYEQGAVEKMLASYALPMRLKHACPAPAKFGSAEPLWKSATVAFLKAVRDVVVSLQAIGNELAFERFVEIWRAIVEGFRGALLADTGLTTDYPSLEDLHAEENFDRSLLLSLEQDVVPSVGTARVPDELVKTVGKTLQLASRLYDLDLPHARHARRVAHEQSFLRAHDDDGGPAVDELTPPPTPPRFDLDFDRQATGGAVQGTTVEVVEVARERFAYWAFDLLFSLCADENKVDDETERRRIAALCLPSLLNRCASTLKTFVADAPLRGKMPFPRIRQEELVYVLQKLVSIRLGAGTLSTATASGGGGVGVRESLLRSPVAHLYELYPLLTAFVALLASSSAAVRLDYVPYRLTVDEDDGTTTTQEGFPSGWFTPTAAAAAAAAAATNRATRGGTTSTTTTDALKLVLEGLELVGTEIQAGRSFF
ncbi:hypothetical protein JCM11491_006311 [Sporobolomyces phaffii]